MPARKNFIQLYKRHSDSCPLLQLPVKPGKTKIKLKFRFDCPCYIWIDGRLPSGAVIPRHSTGETDLLRAEAYRAALLRQDSHRHSQQAIHGLTIDECRDKYLTSWGKQVGDKTLEQHTLALDRLQTYCHARNVLYMSQLTVDLLDTFRTEGLTGISHNSLSTYMAKIHCFLKEAYRKEWIAQPIFLKLTKVHASYEEGGSPYTDEEVKLILDQTLKVRAGKSFGFASKPETMRLMMEVMLDIGLRISDTVQFDPAKMEAGEDNDIYTFIQQKSRRVGKAPKPIEAYLDPALKQRIMDCEWMSPELPFSYGNGAVPLADLTNNFYILMQGIGERCGVADCRPHRLRDTFSARMLEDMTYDELSLLLGHGSSVVTQKHYGKVTLKRKQGIQSRVAMNRAKRNPN